MKLNASFCEKAKDVCCNVDVWGILINIILQVNVTIINMVLKISFVDPIILKFHFTSYTL